LVLFETESVNDDRIDNCLKAITELAEVNKTDLGRQLFGLLLGSYETTATALNGIIWHLINNPSVIEKLKEEIRAHPIPETISDFHKYSYLNKVVREGIRITNNGIVSRKTARGIQYQDHYFPPNTSLILVTGYTHQEIKDWRTFDPDRTDNYKWEPFGTAPRNCLGKIFAQVNIKLIIIKLLSKYDTIPQLSQGAHWERTTGYFKNASFKLSPIVFLNRNEFSVE